MQVAVHKVILQGQVQVNKIANKCGLCEPRVSDGRNRTKNSILTKASKPTVGCKGGRQPLS